MLPPVAHATGRIPRDEDLLRTGILALLPRAGRLSKGAQDKRRGLKVVEVASLLSIHAHQLWHRRGGYGYFLAHVL